MEDDGADEHGVVADEEFRRAEIEPERESAMEQKRLPEISDIDASSNDQRTYWKYIESNGVVDPIVEPLVVRHVAPTETDAHLHGGVLNDAKGRVHISDVESVDRAIVEPFHHMGPARLEAEAKVAIDGRVHRWSVHAVEVVRVFADESKRPSSASRRSTVFTGVRWAGVFELLAAFEFFERPTDAHLTMASASIGVGEKSTPAREGAVVLTMLKQKVGNQGDIRERGKEHRSDAETVSASATARTGVDEVIIVVIIEVIIEVIIVVIVI